jgi:hypothetical protein
MAKQERTGTLASHLFTLCILTFIYFKLSVFQRHHGVMKVREIAGSQQMKAAPENKKAA